MTLSASLNQQIQRHLPEATHFLVGLSGGVDSVCLLHLFSQTDYAVRAIYVHHGLSPNADNWAAFCQQYCQQLGIPFVLKKVLVQAEGSLEQQARQARYQAVRETLLPNEVFTTAHHLDDQAETFLLALKRGSGVKGLGAMQAVNFSHHFTLFRPLLTVPKAEIIAYAKQHNLRWIEDESNQNSDFDRNFLRNEILPQLNQRWQFNQMVARAAAHCQNQQLLLEELLMESLTPLADFKQKSLAIGNFSGFSRQKQQQLLRLWLEKCGVLMPSSVQLMEVLKQMVEAKSDRTPEIKLGNGVLRRYQSTLFLTPEFAETQDFMTELRPNQQMILPDHLGEVVHLGDEIIGKFPYKIDRLQLPKTLKNQSIMIKLHHSGKVSCYGKTQREEMKKIWQRSQIPVWERSRTPLIFYQDVFLGLLKTC